MRVDWSVLLSFSNRRTIFSFLYFHQTGIWRLNFLKESELHWIVSSLDRKLSYMLCHVMPPTVHPQQQVIRYRTFLVTTTTTMTTISLYIYYNGMILQYVFFWFDLISWCLIFVVLRRVHHGFFYRTPRTLCLYIYYFVHLPCSLFLRDFTITTPTRRRRHRLLRSSSSSSLVLLLLFR